MSSQVLQFVWSVPTVSVGDFQDLCTEMTRGKHIQPLLSGFHHHLSKTFSRMVHVEGMAFLKPLHGEDELRPLGHGVLGSSAHWVIVLLHFFLCLCSWLWKSWLVSLFSLSAWELLADLALHCSYRMGASADHLWPIKIQLPWFALGPESQNSYPANALLSEAPQSHPSAASQSYPYHTRIKCGPGGYGLRAFPRPAFFVSINVLKLGWEAAQRLSCSSTRCQFSFGPSDYLHSLGSGWSEQLRPSFSPFLFSAFFPSFTRAPKG